MKMKTILTIAAAVAMATTFAAKGKLPRTESARLAALPEAERATKRAEAIRKVEELHGGVIDCEGMGAMAVVNCQKRVDLSQIKDKLDNLRHISHMTLVETNGTFDLRDVKLPKDVNTAVFVVDDPALPPSLVAVERKWGMMNIASLLADEPDAAKTAKRLGKQFVRIASLTFGGGGTKYSGSPLQPVFEASDLDSVEGEGFTIDVVGAMSRNLGAMGFRAKRRLTYRRACQEGWAPTPTNEFQKAVWEQVKADKERGPTNPITIPPPKK